MDCGDKMHLHLFQGLAPSVSDLLYRQFESQITICHDFFWVALTFELDIYQIC